MIALKKTFVIMCIVTIATVLLLAPFASGNPDGLERVAQDFAFEQKAEQSLISTPFNDYAVSFVSNEKFSTALSGMFGILIVFGLSYALGKVIKADN